MTANPRQNNVDLPVSPALAGFDALLWDLFLRLMDVPGDGVEREILGAQRRICRALGLDRSALWHVSAEDPPRLLVTHLFEAQHDDPDAAPFGGSFVGPDGPMFRVADTALPRYSDAFHDFPWMAKRAVEGQVTIVESVDELPPEAARDLASLRRVGTGASVVLPLKANGSVLGAMSFAVLRARRAWPPELVAQIERAAEVFAKALARKKADEQLREHEARLELAASSAGAGLWELDLTSRRFKVTQTARQLFGFPPEAEVDIPMVLAAVHPDDRDGVVKRMEWFRTHHESYASEYRVVLEDGSVRWLQTRARPYPGVDGTPARVLGATVDVTERRQAEDLAQESRTRLAAAIDVAALGCYELQSESQLLRVDERLRDLLGAGEAGPEELWRLWIERVHPEDAPRVAETSRRMREGELDRVVIDYRYQHPQRGVLWLNHASRVLERGPGGRAARLIGVLQDVSALKAGEESLRQALAEVAQLRDRLEAENVLLNQQVRNVHGFDSIVGSSAALGRVLAQVEHVAPTESPVLLLGETGTGKDLIARAIHDRSRRRERPMVTVNCAALPATLIESELFGYERGAFTGALQRTIGRFEIADRGTLFLDEIGELPRELQAKLLRVLQSGEFERLGSPHTVKANVRLIAATNRDLDREIHDGRFRADLFYRLSVFPISLPPLRDRPEDIPLLVWQFVSRKQVKLGRSIKRIPERLMRSLCAYSWPGNVRELENLVERALILSHDDTLAVDPVLFGTDRAGAQVHGAGTLESVERAHIRAVLVECNWRVAGPGNAAERLGINRSTLQFRMKKLGIERPRPEAHRPQPGQKLQPRAKVTP